jgi:hypothetical protein
MSEGRDMWSVIGALLMFGLAMCVALLMKACIDHPPIQNWP